MPLVRRILKWAFRGIVVIGLILVVTLFAFRTPDTDPQAMMAKYSSPDSQFLDTGDARIHYRDQGPRNAPVLLLVHGGNGSLHTWEKMIDALDDRYRLISFDMPGHGLTGPSKSGDYSASAMTKVATQVLDSARVKNATWVGNSMGGWIVWRAALDVPGRVNAIVLLDAAGAQGVQPIKPYLGARLSQSWLGRLVMPHVTPESIIRSSLVQTVADSGQVTDTVVKRYWELLRYPGNRKAAGDRSLVDREPDKWNEIGSLKMPVLLIWGKKDSVIPVAHGTAFAKAIKGSSLIIIEKAGHLPMEEQPVEVAKAIDIWMTKPKTP